MKILKFSLPTCRPCVTLSEQMEELDLSNFEIQEVSLRANKVNKELGDKYNIRSVPTLVVLDKQENEIARIRNIVQFKDFLKTKSVPIYEVPTEKIENIRYVAGLDDYKEEKSWINKIKIMLKRIFIKLPLYILQTVVLFTGIIPIGYYVITGKSYLDFD